MRNSTSRRFLMGCLAVFFACGVARAGEVVSVQWDVPAWVDATQAFDVRVALTPPVSGEPVWCLYRYPDGTEGKVEFKAEGDAFSGRVPGAVRAQVGEMSLKVRVGAADSGERIVPVAYVEELDITGDPPVVLPYALGDVSHLVRYIPCCNILGGAMTASRIPVNPKETSKGLPDRFASDFVVLDPDELTASTAGTHMQFALGADAVGPLVAYEYDWKIEGWRPVLSFEVDEATGTVDFHCPDGGTYVIGSATRE